MWYNLDKKHRIKEEIQEKLITKAATESKNPKISTFFQKQPIEEVISRLTASDKFRFNPIVNSSYFQSGISEKGYDFPKTQTRNPVS